MDDTTDGGISKVANTSDGIEVLLLGAAQDGGFPQFGCKCENCRKVYRGEIAPDSAVSLAVIDYTTKQWWLFDPTPQLSQQWNQFASTLCELQFAGAFITHAHAGHYPGILYFGKEALNCSQLPLYCSVSMHRFLSANEPWKVLYTNQNITPVEIQPGVAVRLSAGLQVTPIRIEHRADFTDTLCFAIKGLISGREMLFCPDIDSWNQCAHVTSPVTATSTPTSIPTVSLDTSPKPLRYAASDASGCDVMSNWLQQVLLLHRFDVLLLDATFYDSNELTNRDMGHIPHPRVVDTVSVVQHFKASTGKNDDISSIDSISSCRSSSSSNLGSRVQNPMGDDNFGDKGVNAVDGTIKTAVVVLIHLNHSNRLWVEPELATRLQTETGIVTGKQGMNWYF